MTPSTLVFAALLGIIGFAHSVVVQVPYKQMNITMGQSVTLICGYTTTANPNNSNIAWTFLSVKTYKMEQFYYYQGGQSAVTGQFTGRVTAVPGATNASITISNMQPSDTGSYTCTVNNMDDMNGQNQGSIFVSVFVKPSKPYCAVHGSVELGHLVSLICKSEEGIPAPTYTWHKLDQGTTRSALGQMNTQSGILSIGNLSQFEFGQYQCNSSNSLGVATCTVELSEVHDGAIAGAVIGAILGAALIALIVWIVAHNVRRRKYNAKQGATTEMKAVPQADDSVKYKNVPTKEIAPANSNSVEVEAEPMAAEAKPETEEA